MRQETLLRAIVDKLATRHLLSDPVSGFGILNAFTGALSVDSDFSNSQLQSLATHLNLLGQAQARSSRRRSRMVTCAGR